MLIVPSAFALTNNIKDLVDCTISSDDNVDVLGKKIKDFQRTKTKSQVLSRPQNKSPEVQGFSRWVQTLSGKKTLTAILSKLNALINLLHLGFYFNLKALLCIVKDKRQNNLK